MAGGTALSSADLEPDSRLGGQSRDFALSRLQSRFFTGSGPVGRETGRNVVQNVSLGSGSPGPCRGGSASSTENHLAPGTTTQSCWSSFLGCLHPFSRKECCPSLPQAVSPVRGLGTQRPRTEEVQAPSSVRGHFAVSCHSEILQGCALQDDVERLHSLEGDQFRAWNGSSCPELTLTSH